MWLYPEIKSNIYVRNNNRDKTQYMWRVTDAGLSGVTRNVAVEAFYSWMCSCNYSFIHSNIY